MLELDQEKCGNAARKATIYYGFSMNFTRYNRLITSRQARLL